MSNVLDSDTQQQVLALGRQGCSLRRIGEDGSLPRNGGRPSEGSQNSGAGALRGVAAKTATTTDATTDMDAPKPATMATVSIDAGSPAPQGRTLMGVPASPYNSRCARRPRRRACGSCRSRGRQDRAHRCLENHRTVFHELPQAGSASLSEGDISISPRTGTFLFRVDIAKHTDLRPERR
jgi:hypothetical protein